VPVAGYFYSRLAREPTPGNANTGKSLEFKPVTAISLDSARVLDRQPPNPAQERFLQEGEFLLHSGLSRRWSQLIYSYEASAIGYSPLYFAEDALERCGHYYGCWQPAVSAAHFFGRIPLLPYMYGANNFPCHYSLGYCRPGDCVPHYVTTPRWSLRGATYQAAAMTGVALAVPEWRGKASGLASGIGF